MTDVNQSTTTQETQGYVQTKYDLPVLKLKDASQPGTVYSSLKPSYYFSNLTSSSVSEFGYRVGFKLAPNELNIFSIALEPLVSNPTSYVSNPGAVIQEEGFEFTYSAAESTGESSTASALIAEPLVLFTNGPEVTPKIKQQFSFTYLSEFYQTLTERLKVKWSTGDTTYKQKLKVKWERNVNLTSKRLRLRTSYEREATKKVKDQYVFRYVETLPEDVITKKFLITSWETQPLKTEKIIFKSSWTAEVSSFRTQELKVKWDLTLSDMCIVKPYYIEKTVNKQVIHCISFQVYVDYEYLQHFIENDEVYFYFSNPPKYELIRFDYNAAPYQDVFIKSINDPILIDRQNVPPNFLLLGNYTIENISINNSCSLDIMANIKQINEYRSYWIPENISSYKNSFTPMPKSSTSTVSMKMLPLDKRFRDDHHEDIVELDLVIVTETECCFTRKDIGTTCSPY